MGSVQGGSAPSAGCGSRVWSEWCGSNTIAWMASQPFMPCCERFKWCPSCITTPTAVCGPPTERALSRHTDVPSHVAVLRKAGNKDAQELSPNCYLHVYYLTK